MRSIKVEGLDIPWTALTLGCLQIAPSKDWGDVCSEEEADRVVKTALEGGIMAFDTAECYGNGESERRLGKALGSRKNDVLIISKITPDAEMTLEAYQSRLEGTLKALGRDYVDAYLVHWPGMYLDTMEKTQKDVQHHGCPQRKWQDPYRRYLEFPGEGDYPDGKSRLVVHRQSGSL